MVEETVRKIEETINKLFSNPPKFGTTPVHKRSGEATLLIGRKRPHSSLPVMNLENNVLGEPLSLFSGSSKSAQPATCKPWDRHDFFNRLSTFKSITWFAKPRVVSPLECARRGWINADVDTIFCSSCGGRLHFATPSSWTQQQVERAATGFSSKLEGGHKVLCPWINNACAEEIAYFPNLLDNVLAEDYKRRATSLLQLAALPAIPLSIVGNLKNSHLTQFLGPQSNKMSSENRVAELHFSYCQAKKLISLLGWEPCILPHDVGSEDAQKSIEDAAVIINAAQNQRVKVYSLCTSDGTGYFNEWQVDTSSVILHCKLCGASVGLGAFNNIPPPLEYLRVVGPEEIHAQGVPAHDDTNVQEDSSAGDTLKNAAATPVTPLGFTIAGGPPPALLDYSPTISLPIIGKNLRSRIADDTVVKDPVTLEMPEQVEKSHQLSSNDENVPVEGTSIMPRQDSIMANAIGETLQGRVSESNSEEIGEAETCGHCSSMPCKCLVAGDAVRVLSTSASKEFDPIKQHRPFCPWINSTEKYTPGWQQTLSALQDNMELNKLTDFSTIEVRNPVSMAMKLFATEGKKKSKIGD